MRNKQFFLAFLSSILFANAYSQANNQHAGDFSSSTVLIPQQVNAVTSSFKDFSMYSPHNFLNGSVLNTFNNSENTKGRRYFFDSWVKGTVLTADGRTVQADSFLFNLDKVASILLVTIDKKNVIEVNKDAVHSFSLSGQGQTYSFEKVETINPDKYFQVLVKKEGGYTLYKSVNTHLVKADYNTNGLSESGNPYDEYIDAAQYYIRLPDGKTIKNCTLKLKSIKEALSLDKTKVNEWLSQHSSYEIDESFLQGLTVYLNQ
jgi:hypothetical protein